jgi:hypothetical protein
MWTRREFEKFLTIGQGRSLLLVQFFTYENRKAHYDRNATHNAHDLPCCLLVMRHLHHQKI